MKQYQFRTTVLILKNIEIIIILQQMCFSA